MASSPLVSVFILFLFSSFHLRILTILISFLSFLSFFLSFFSSAYIVWALSSADIIDANSVILSELRTLSETSNDSYQIGLIASALYNTKQPDLAYKLAERYIHRLSLLTSHPSSTSPPSISYIHLFFILFFSSFLFQQVDFIYGQGRIGA